MNNTVNEKKKRKQRRTYQHLYLLKTNKDEPEMLFCFFI